MSEKYHRCFLCGKETDFPIGGDCADWYLCSDCAGTKEAEDRGFVHHKQTAKIKLSDESNA